MIDTADFVAGLEADRWCAHCNRVKQVWLAVNYDAWQCRTCFGYTTGLEFATMACPECGRKRREKDGETCFRCRVATVGVNWHGGGFNFGRNNFHDRTNAEYVAEHVGDVKGNPNIAHIGSLDFKDV